MGRVIVISAVRIVSYIGAALIVGVFLGSQSNIMSPTMTMESGKEGAFVLFVNLKFTSLTHRDRFLKLIEPVCEDVLHNEGPAKKSTIVSSRGISREEKRITTLSYQVAISDQDPLKVAILERYSDKDNGYMTIHRSGSEFLKFRDQLKDMQEVGDVVIDGSSFIETDLGYV
jgi:hypothetical protein